MSNCRDFSQDKRKSIDQKIWWLFLLAIVGAVVFQWGYTRAFPAAALNLNTPREKIEQTALAWTRQIGFIKPKTINSTTFTELADQKAFLEQQLGQDEANRIMSNEIPTWLWCSRFCQEYNSDECRIWLTPNKQLVRLSRDLRNDLALPTLSRDEAKIMARSFVEDKVGTSLASYTLIRDESRSLIKRTDHDFIWEDRGRDYAGGRLRLEVKVSGNQISSLTKYLHIPEEWQGQYAATRSYNMLLYHTAQIVWVALLLFGLAVFVWATARHQIRWKVSIAAAVIFALVSLAQDLNNYPAAIAAYPTQIEFNTYLIQYLVACLNRAGALFAAALILGGAGEYIYRRLYPQRVAVEHWLKMPGLASKEVSRGLLVGHFLAAIYLGWVIFYYLIGKQLDFWTPLQVESPTVLSSTIPAFSAVYLGVSAAAHEEVVYRVLALVAFSWLLKLVPMMSARPGLVFWLANLLQAAAWGFMHSTYPQQPAFARGLELTIAGMLFGWVFQVFGLLPCLVGHYLIDAFLTARPLLTAAQPGLSVTAVLAVVPFLGLYLATVIVRRRAKRDSDNTDHSDHAAMSNANLQMPLSRINVEAISPDPNNAYVGHSAKARVMAIVVMIFAVAFSLWLRSHPAVGDPARLRINRDQAIKIARQILAERKISDRDFNVSVKFVATWTGPQSQYVFEHMPLQSAIRVIDRVRFTYFWKVRFFRPNHQLEYSVELDGRGRETNLSVVQSEAQPGARLTAVRARQLVEAFLLSRHPEVLPLVFDNVSEYHRDDRTDYIFNFISPSLSLPDAPYKVNCGIAGDLIFGFEDMWQVPDQWREARDRKTLIHHISYLCKTACQDLFIVLTAWWAVVILRTGAVSWRLPLIAGAGMAMVALATQINNFPTFFADYVTSTPINNFTLQQTYTWLNVAVNVMAEFTLTSAFALVVWRIVFPKIGLAEFMRTTLLPVDATQRLQQKKIWIDAVVFAYAVGSVRWLIDSLAYYALREISPNVPDAGLPLITSMLNTLVPGLDTVFDLIMRASREELYAAIFAGLYLKYARGFPRFGIMLVLVALLFCLDMKHFEIQDYLISVIRTLLESLLVWFFIARLARQNVLAYALSGVVLVVTARLPAALEHAPRVLLADIVVCTAWLLLPVAYCFWLTKSVEKAG